MTPFLVAFLFFHARQAPSLAAAARPQNIWSYVPQRVYDTPGRSFGDFESYLAGSISEDRFLAGSRPWSKNASDYRPLIEFAREHQIPVIASDLPRRIASAVSKTGMSAVDSLSVDRPSAARDPQCPMNGDYYDRFIKAMDSGHPIAASDAPAGGTRARSDRFYLAQCLKDETMGEAIADAWQWNEARRAVVVHVNGSFHSDYAEGTAASAARRLPGRRIAVVSFVPVGDIDTKTPDADAARLGDFLVFTVKPII